MRKLIRTTTILIFLGVMGIGLAFWGWLQQGYPVSDSIVEAVQVLSLDSTYDRRENWTGNDWLDWARWFGLAFFTFAALKAFGLLLSQQLADLRAQVGVIDVAIIGDHPSLASLCRAAAQHKRKVLWLAPLGLAPAAIPQIPGVRIVDRPWETRLCHRYRLGRAETIIVAFADYELRGLDAAVAVRADFPTARIILLTANSTISDALRRVPALVSVQVMVAAESIARLLLESHPPFLLARDAGHQRLHCLILGCGNMGEALIGGILLSVRRQNIWRRSRRRLAECGPRLGIDIRRRVFGAASADVRWSVA